MKEKKEVGPLKELERKVESEVETAFLLRDAWRLRYLRNRIKICIQKIPRFMEECGDGKEAVKAEEVIFMFEATARRIDTLLEILGTGEKQKN